MGDRYSFFPRDVSSGPVSTTNHLCGDELPGRCRIPASHRLEAGPPIRRPPDRTRSPQANDGHVKLSARCAHPLPRTEIRNIPLPRGVSPECGRCCCCRSRPQLFLCDCGFCHPDCASLRINFCLDADGHGEFILDMPDHRTVPCRDTERFDVVGKDLLKRE